MSLPDNIEETLFGGDVVYLVDGKPYVAKSTHQTILPNISVVIKLEPYTPEKGSENGRTEKRDG